MRSQAGAWEREKLVQVSYIPSWFKSGDLNHFLVPKPRLRASRHGKPGLPLQVRSQAGAWEREIQSIISQFPEEYIFSSFPRSQAPAWERICARSPSFGLPVILREAGASPASAFPSRGLGTRNTVHYFAISRRIYFFLVSSFPSPGLGTHLRPKP